jgi:23S rRNA (adenine2030-N6)-methyltransferase
MLSYQHAYHAGNLADVHKHAALAFVLDYLARKPKPLSYLETHAGRGLYDLAGPEAAKTGEAAGGIGRLRPPAAHPYARVLAAARARFGAAAYPGSPLIAALLLRPVDRLALAELHPQEHAALRDTLVPLGAQVVREDGLAFALARTPPVPRRGLLLADPSFEVKADYEAVPRGLLAVHRKWNVGTLMLWYPILDGAPHLAITRAVTQAVPAALISEVRFPPPRPGHRMRGSGLIVINPPWGMQAALQEIEAWIAG